MKSRWQTISSKLIHKNKWFSVRDDEVIRPDGKPGHYYVIDCGPPVFIVALTENKEVYLIKQYRYPTASESIEIPGGGSDGQDLLLAAKRELKEETGLIAKEWQKLGEIDTMNGISSEVMHVFAAKKLSQSGSNKHEDEGITEVVCLPWQEAMRWIKEGKIHDSQSIAALMLAEIHLDV